MSKIYFGELSTGRLARLPYLGYSLLLVAMFLAIGFAILQATKGVGALLGGGDPINTNGTRY